MTGNQITWWVGFNVFVLGMLALDLGVFNRRAHIVKLREALAWTGVWVGLALFFNYGLWQGWLGSYPPELRGPRAMEFLTAYLVEKSLSVDNIFVFALIFGYFRVPAIYQHRVLFYGILGALLMRAAMIFAGVALIAHFHWVMYLFGAILIISGIKMFKSDKTEIHPERNLVLRLFRRLVPVTAEYREKYFWVVENSRRTATPLLVVLVLMETSDVVFAVDSIPAVLAISQDTFIVYTSNIFAILGLRALYFALAGLLSVFHYLHYGLSVLLVYIGVKMLVADYYKIPNSLSFGIIVIILTVSIVASLLVKKRPPPPSGA